MIERKRRSSDKFKKAMFGVLSFVMSVMLFMLTVCVTLQVTIFNSVFIIDNMNSSNYFVDKKDEICRSLTDLGYATGLEEEFFEGLLNEVTILSDTEEYLKHFYDGKGTRIDDTSFRQQFNKALDEYILEHNISNVSGSAIEYMISRACNIYKSLLEIPVLSMLSAYMLNIRNVMPFVIIGISVMIAIILAIMFFANKWKHRVYKYVAYATGGAFLSVGVLSAAGFLTGIFSKINLSSRALYNLVVKCGDSILIALAACALAFLVICIACVITHNKKRKKLMGS